MVLTITVMFTFPAAERSQFVDGHFLELGVLAYKHRSTIAQPQLINLIFLVHMKQYPSCISDAVTPVSCGPSQH